MELLRHIGLLLKKEFTLEWRQRNSLYSLLLYIGGTVFICYLSFALKTNKLGPITWNALFWIIFLFVAISAMTKSFALEKKERNFYYYYITSPEAIILSKIIYNIILMVVLAGLTVGGFTMVMQIEILDPEIFLLNLLLGAMGFASTLTLVSGIAAKAEHQGTLMAVLSLPIVIPMLLVLIKVSNHAIDGLSRGLIEGELITLGALNVIVVAVSYILFPYLWKS